MKPLLNADFVRHRRIRCGLSRRAVARRLGVSVTVINGLEHRRTDQYLSLRLLGLLAECLAVEVADLLVGSNGTDRHNAVSVSIARNALSLATVGHHGSRDDPGP